MNRKRLVGFLLVTALLAVSVIPAGAQSVTHTAKAARAVPTAVLASPLSVNTAGAAPLANWSAGGAMAVPVDNTGGGAALGTKAYAAGGCTAAGGCDAPHDTMQVYSLVSNAWVSEAEVLPITTLGFGTGYFYGAVCTNPDTSKIHFVNGATEVPGMPGFAYLWSAQQIYDPTAPAGGRWSFANGPVLSTGEVWYGWLGGCGFVGPAGARQLYYFGGYAQIDPATSPSVVANTWKWDPVTDSWTDTAQPLNTARVYFGYTSSTAGASAAYVSGGATDFSGIPTTDTAERYTTAGGWVNTTPLPAASGGGRIGHGMSLVGSNVLVYGGAVYDSVMGVFVLQSSTLRCKMNGFCASWTNPNRNLVTPRWFGSWASLGSFGTLAGFWAGGADVAGTSGVTERLP